MDSYSFEHLRVLSGHSSTIKDLIWLSKDKRLLTSCYNGNINIWRSEKEWQKEVEHFTLNKMVKYLGVDYDPEFD